MSDENIRAGAPRPTPRDMREWHWWLCAAGAAAGASVLLWLAPLLAPILAPLLDERVYRMLKVALVVAAAGLVVHSWRRGPRDGASREEWRAQLASRGAWLLYVLTMLPDAHGGTNAARFALSCVALVLCFRTWTRYTALRDVRLRHVPALQPAGA